MYIYTFIVIIYFTGAYYINIFNGGLYHTSCHVAGILFGPL